MAVPNTTTFTMQDVRLALGLPSNTNLAQCVTTANSQGGWDASYSGSKNSLLNFRNYTAPPALTSFYRTNISSKAGFFSCSYTTNLRLWHNGTGYLPVDGNIVYSNSAGTAFAPQGFFGFAPTNGSPAQTKGYISSSGVVSNAAICSLQ